MVSAETITLTPELARQFLTTQAPNRVIRKSVVEELSAEIIGGRWRFTHQGLGFDENGRMIDGQHRCMAVVETGVSVNILKVSGLKSDAADGVDRQARRSVADVLRMSNPTFGYTQTMLAVANAMYRPGNVRRKTSSLGPGLAREFISQYADGIVFVQNRFNHGKAGLSAALRACFARAWYHTENEARLSDMIALLYRPELAHAVEQPSPALLLGRSLDMFGLRRSSVAPHLKAERAILAFLAFEKLEKLYQAKCELYPLPGEERWSEGNGLGTDTDHWRS